MVRGDILKTSCKNIAFAVNVEGVNDAGFAGEIARRFWPELIMTGTKEMGEVLSKSVGEKTFYALVCHSLRKDGWRNTPEVLEKCLNSLYIRGNEDIAIVLIGAGLVGQMGGADVIAILGAMARSNKRLIVYTL